jgi:hypothetical protein
MADFTHYRFCLSKTISSDRGRKVGEIVSQMEASDLPELGNISRSSFECALRTLIKHGSMIEAIKLLRQYVGLD